MKLRNSKKGSILYIAALVIVSAAVLVFCIMFGRGTDNTIDKIIHEHDDEDRYAGLGGRPTIEAELDYMILKYANGLDHLKEDEDDDDQQDDDQKKDDDQQDDDQKKDDQQDDDKKPEGPDPDWKNQIFAMYKAVDTDVTITPAKDVTFDTIFQALDIECRYMTGEDGIFPKWYSYTTSEHEDYNLWNLHVDYTRDIDEIKRIKEMTAEKEDAEVAAKLNVAGMSDEQKINAVNEFVCDYTEYYSPEPYPDQSHTAYGALFEYECVCDGYSRFVKMICDDIGIDCKIVIGDVINAGGHAWNLVKIDGKWYHLDVTWNDGCGNRKEYYLIPDSFLDPYRVWNHDMYPEVSKTPYNR